MRRRAFSDPSRRGPRAPPPELPRRPERDTSRPSHRNPRQNFETRWARRGRRRRGSRRPIPAAATATFAILLLRGESRLVLEVNLEELALDDVAQPGSPRMCSTERTRAHVLRARYPSQTHLRSFADASATSTAPRVDEKLPREPFARGTPPQRLRRRRRASRRPRRALHVPFERLVSRSVSGGFVSTLRLGEHSPQPRIKNLIRQRARHRRVNQPGRIRRERHSRGGLTSRVARERRRRVAGSLVSGSRVLRRRLSHGLSRSPVHGSCWDGRVRGSRVLRRRLSHGLSRSPVHGSCWDGRVRGSRVLRLRPSHGLSRSPVHVSCLDGRVRGSRVLRLRPSHGLSRSPVHGKLLGRSRSRKSRSSS